MRHGPEVNGAAGVAVVVVVTVTIVVVVVVVDSQVQLLPIQITVAVQTHIPESMSHSKLLLSLSQSSSVSHKPLEIICNLHSLLLQTMSDGQSASSTQDSVQAALFTEQTQVLLAWLQL